ncbi:hypothetical protein [Massilia sp. CF038]|uniref:hypothetical protein n=1 Tax=Massilia sp. CF038 TaxID=1881045 RepID=UPI00091EA7A2|nr:hypothetical protein [Massilia sp. CF038]SHG70393.1 hypothetical protein SAMN05428948_1687 [Massilia sp. CF038]
MRFATIVLALVAITLTGCAASGKPYDAQAWDLEITRPEQVRLTVFRTSETLVASGRDAKVTLNNRESKYCAHAGYASFTTVAGKQMLNVELTPETNRCEVRVDAKPGEELFFEIRPNKDLILGRAISAGVGAGLAHGGVYGTGNDPMGKMNNCQSFFSMVPVERSAALKILSDVHESSQ